VKSWTALKVRRERKQHHLAFRPLSWVIPVGYGESLACLK